MGLASFEISKSGLMVNQRALEVTGHNISNVNTPGYTRQRAVITSGPVQNGFNSNGPYQIGLGADIQEIRQIRHTFLDNIYRQENTTQGYWEARNKTFQDIQGILVEPIGNGLQNFMNQFWDSWQELSKQPDSLTIRALVTQRGETLVQKINQIGVQLDKQQTDLNSEVMIRIGEVNDLTAQIANLNNLILKYEVNGDNANDYRDQRNTAVDKLSRLINADVTEMNDGQLTVTINGYLLVNKNIQTRLCAGISSAGGSFYSPMLEGTNIEVKLKSGSMKGLLESRGEVFGAKGSPENGSPFTISDINFVLDISDNSIAGQARLQNIKDNIANYVDEINRIGVDFNINLLTFDGSGTSLINSYGTDTTSFVNDLNGISTTGIPVTDFANVVNVLDGLTYRQDANKYAVVFTENSIAGNGGAAITDATPYNTVLKNKNIITSVVTDLNYFNAGDTGEIGWNSITGSNGGHLYDINLSDTGNLLTTIAMDNVNHGISLVNTTNNIIPDLRKRLNALINVMAREVNNLHKSGITLNGANGQDFFVPANPAYPLEMGNIRLNGNLKDLNNIVSSLAGSSGDNTIALKIANLRTGYFMNDANRYLNLDEYYQSIILAVGNSGLDANNISSNQQILVQSADAARQSIAGVSMDEEMTNMMKYKFAVDAASKAINVIDQMLETLISRMGLVGR